MYIYIKIKIFFIFISPKKELNFCQPKETEQGPFDIFFLYLIEKHTPDTEKKKRSMSQEE